MTETYDEDKELDRYILNYYPNLMTELESQVQEAVFANEKAATADSEKMKKIINKKWGHKNNPEIEAILDKGIDTFRRKTRERIVNEHNDEIYINKCPQCSKLVKTPVAKMCLWCGHSWR